MVRKVRGQFAVPVILVLVVVVGREVGDEDGVEGGGDGVDIFIEICMPV